MIPVSVANSGVWGMDPVLGVVGDYATNPALLDVPNTGATNGALLLDAPTTFNADAFKFFVLPSFRLSDSKGYSSVTSDYEHLNVKAEFDSERSVLTAAAGIAQDSSLYQDYLINGTAGVRRDSATADLDWNRLLTERLTFDADVNSSRTTYGQSVGTTSLVDYKYTSITPTLSWNTTARDKFTLAANVSRYESLDGTTESRNGDVQLGFVSQLSELWTLTASGGYSRELNAIDFNEPIVVNTPSGPVLGLLPVRVESSQNGAVYQANLSHQGSLLTLTAIASRQLIPSGYAFPSRQNNFEVRADYSLTTRWSLGADVREVKAQDPELQGQIVDRTLKYFTVNANWQWTEHWSLKMSASRVTELYQSYNLDLASNEVAITLSRQFNHIKFQ
jgi:hypothetical protein